jgi:hypothetical protein
MSEKYSMNSFISDIDKIISGEVSISVEYEDCDEEYKELLLIAQALVEADFTSECQSRIKKKNSTVLESGELDDDELDMVAGGVNLNKMSDEEEKM